MNSFDIIFSGFFDHIGVVCISVLFLSGVYILYKAYKAELPSLDINLSIINKDSYRGMLEERSSGQTVSTLDHDLYLRVYIINTGKRIISPTQICNDKDNKIVTILTETGFEYVLKSGEEYSNVHPLDENLIKIIRESKRLYVKDFAERKFPVPRKRLHAILSGLNKNG